MYVHRHIYKSTFNYQKKIKKEGIGTVYIVSIYILFVPTLYTFLHDIKFILLSAYIYSSTKIK